MKKETFTNKFINKLSAIIFISFSFVFLSTDCIKAQCQLSCDDDVQVSVDSFCKAIITPEMMLEDRDPSCTYTVTVYDVNGLPLPTPIVNSSHVGKKLKVRVSANGNSCWGNVSVEDKYGPFIVCPKMDTIFCNNTGYTPLSPQVYDNCGGTVTRHVLSDNLVKYECDSVMAGKRTIIYFYTDKFNNSSDTCKQMIFFKKIDYSILMWPRDTILSCRYYTAKPPLNITGTPKLAGYPLYPDWSICKIAVTYEDDSIGVCPATFKILRKWTLLDWCQPSGKNVTTHYQIIKVVDEEGPVVSCAPDITVSTDVWSCTGTVVIAPPTIIRECSRTSYLVGYKTSNSGVITYTGSNSSTVQYLPNGFVSVSGLPLGKSWVIFRVTDQCDNYTDCATEVTIADQIPPIAVCDQKTTVAVTIDGTAKVDAFTFDDGSHDNCAIDRFEVARMDSGFWRQYAYFGCNDIGKTLMVSMRVWDKAGNSNTCMVEVVVQDKFPPVISCPPHITISCEYNYTDLNVFGRVVTSLADRKPINVLDSYVKYSSAAIDGYAYDGCGVTVTETSSPTLTCGKGTIVRTFTATDPKGLSSVCQQIITISDFTPNNIVITPPIDYYSSTICLSKPQLTPDVTGKPIIKGQDKCSNIATTYEDLTFTFEPDACIKILRRWYVIDWCRYDPNAQNPVGYWTYVQTIKVNNTVAPVFLSNCNNRSVDVFGPGCQGQVELIGRASDDCTDSTDLIWFHEVDIDNNGSVDPSYTGAGRNASAVYPVGVHKVTFRVKDNCGNENKCTFLLTVLDKKKPTPYCQSSISTVIMPSTKNIVIWAKDYNLNSEDNCTTKPNIQYYFLVNGTFFTSMRFDCSNIGKNKIKVYAVDSLGNSDYCEVEIDIQDPNHTCPTGLSVQGKVITPEGRGVNNVGIVWERTNPSGTNSGATDVTGTYAFPNMTPGMDYILKADKNYNHLNGVSTQDILQIQKHILGQVPFNTPYKYIAADANNSSTITAADLSEIRKLILGVTNEYNHGQKSWRFIPVSHVFTDPTNPFPYPETINLNGLNGNNINKDFYAVKIGDISGNADVGLFGTASSRNKATLDLYIDDQKIEADQDLDIPVMLSQDQILSGFQLAMTHDANLVFEGLSSELKDMTTDNYHYDNNTIKLSYTNTEALDLKKGQVVFIVHFKALKAMSISKAMSINEKLIEAEAYDQNIEAMDIRMSVRNGNTQGNTAQTCQLFQNVPNPFTNETTISIFVPHTQNVHVAILDMNGRTVKQINKTLDKGNHEFKISKADLGQAGVYFIQMNSQDYTETKKMVLIR